MLLLFNKKKEQQNLPDVSIRDVSDNQPTPIACIPDWDNDLIQVQELVNSPLVFQELGSISAGNYTYFKTSQRRQYALVSATFSDTGANAVVYPVYRDKNGEEVIGSSLTVTEAIDGKAPLAKFDVFGASSMRFYIKSISSGTLSLQVAFV